MRWPRDDRGERGGVSILVIAVFVVALGLVIGAARLGTALVGKARAETVADAAALAAADSLALGRGDAVASARAIAARNGGTLVSCDCAGRHAQVTVDVPVHGLAGHSHARATARAEVRSDRGVSAR